jgi:hypothetical protein
VVFQPSHGWCCTSGNDPAEQYVAIDRVEFIRGD